MQIPPSEDQDAEAAEGRPSLRQAIRHGLLWKAASQIVVQVTRLAVAVAVARLLAPEEYGLAGMALVFSSFVLIFSDVGLGSALVQRRSLDRLDTSSAFWMSVVTGAVWTVVGIAASGPIASFFGEPRLAPMVVVLSFGFLIRSLALTQSALLVRSMSFRALELREMGATMVGASIGLTLAVGGVGAWAIVGQQLAATCASTVLVWHYSDWHPSLNLSVARLRTFVRFTANVFGTNILGQLRATTDNLLIGRFLGATALGSYALAYNIILLPFGRIAVPLSQVLFPALSRVQDDLDRVRRYWLRALRMITAIAMPSLIGLIILAPDFVEVLLGPAWRASVPVLQLLAVVGILQTIQFLNPTVLQVLDRTTLLVRWALFSYGASVVAFVVGLRWGIVGVASAYAVAAFVTECGFLALTARAAGVGLKAIVRAVGGVAQAAIAMGVIVLGLRALLVATGVPASARLGILSMAGGALFIALCAWRAPNVLADARGFLPTRGRDTSGDVSIAESR